MIKPITYMESKAEALGVVFSDGHQGGAAPNKAAPMVAA